MHKLTAGDGYQYLIRQVAAVDSTSRGKAPLIDYYSSKGESPGHWVGSGLASLESTGARWVPAGDVADVWAVEAGSQVSEAQMKALFGEGLHPNADAIAAYVTKRGVHGVAAARSHQTGPPVLHPRRRNHLRPRPGGGLPRPQRRKPARTGTRPSTRPPAPRSAPSSRAESSPNSTAARPPTTANSPAT